MQILLNDKDFGIKYIKLKRNENIIEDVLLLKIDKAYRQDILDLVEYEGKLSINAQLRDVNFFNLYTVTFVTDYILSEEHDSIEEILLEVNMTNNINDWNGIYNQLIVDIFYSWSKNVEIDWVKVDDSERKNAYLKACYLWSHRYFVIKNFNIHIKGEYINCEEDFYYYLGEYLIGKRGYFGRNLDSLEDFLIDVVKNNNVKTTITVSDADIIIKNTDEYFFKTIVRLLEKAGFKVEVTN